MKIEDHRLLNDDGTPCPSVPSPNIGGNVQPKYLVMHFTAGRSAQESIAWLANEKAKASAHLVIGRDGRTTQLVPFDRVAWHAGASSWEGLTGLNRYSIGIELDNAGRLVRQGDGWRTWFALEIPQTDVIKAVHKFESVMCGWHAYTPEQIESALRIAALLIETYKLQDVVGHEDIAPHRKCDPGPAFPMASFRSRLLGRAEERPPEYRTTTELNIRTGPGVQNPLVPGSPLPEGTVVQSLQVQGNWWKVDVLKGAGVSADLEGWVNSRYLERVEE